MGKVKNVMGSLSNRMDQDKDIIPDLKGKMEDWDNQTTRKRKY